MGLEAKINRMIELLERHRGHTDECLGTIIKLEKEGYDIDRFIKERNE